MKNVQLFFVLALAAAASCVPVTKNPADDAEVVIVPLEGSQQDVFDLDDGIVDTGYPGGFFSPFSNPFSGFMTSMDEMMKRLHDQMSQVLHRLPADNGDWKDIADGKGNTTSTTKVINGHKVTVNETVYGDGDDNGGSFFKIRIVDVRPASEENSDSSEEKADTKPKSVITKEIEETTPKHIAKGNSLPELSEESANEIPRGKPEKPNELDYDVETFGEDMSSELFPEESMQSIKMSNPEYFGLDDIDIAAPVKEVETNEVNVEPIDLSNDIYVNTMMADAGAPHNPDAEVFDVDERQFKLSQPYYRHVQRMQDPSYLMIKRK